MGTKEGFAQNGSVVVIRPSRAVASWSDGTCNITGDKYTGSAAIYLATN